jgi:PAS domain S-box-containing protein
MDQTKELGGQIPSVQPVQTLNENSKSTPLSSKLMLIILQVLILLSLFFLVKSFVFPSNIKWDASDLSIIFASLLAVSAAFFILAKFQIVLQDFSLKSEKMEKHVEERTTELLKINEHMRFEIHERKRVEGALKESEGRFRTIVREAAIGIAIIDKDGRMQESNPALQMMLGYLPLELEKVPFTQLLYPEDARKSKKMFNELLYGYRTDVRTEKRYIRKDGKIRWGSQSISLVREITGEPKFFIAMVEDVTERRLAEEKIRGYQEQLQSLASELSLSEERERRTLAGVLHDHIGQLLSMAKMKLEELQDSAVYRGLVSPIKEVHKMIEKSISYTRSLIFELSPPILYDVGFEATVEWLAEQMRQQHHLQVEVEAYGQTDQLDKEMRGLLFRAVRELLFNVIKHAQASRAKIKIQRSRGNLQVEVEDDGVGFKEQESLSEGTSHGFGLFSIRERITYFGGRLDIESLPGQGTRVTLRMPLKNRKNKDRQQGQVSAASLPSRAHDHAAPVKEVAAN